MMAGPYQAWVASLMLAASVAQNQGCSPPAYPLKLMRLVVTRTAVARIGGNDTRVLRWKNTPSRRATSTQLPSAVRTLTV